jgi:FAD-linked sulfhydryl oxidase
VSHWSLQQQYTSDAAYLSSEHADSVVSGECAGHFRQILEKNPPQVSSRNAAAGWACHVHNEVNLSLKKDVFDCSKIGDFYDCGCAEDDEAKKSGKAGELKQEKPR